MRIVLLAVGSRGDVQPFVELAAGLEAGGYDAVVATHPPYREMVERRGVRYVCIGKNVSDLFERTVVMLMGETGRNPIAWARNLRDVTRDLWDELVPDCVAACEDADAVLYGVMGHPGYSIAEQKGIPSVGAALQPVSATRAFPNINLGTAVASFGSTGNRVSHAVGEQLAWLPIGRLVQRWRRDELGLPPIRRGGLLRQLRKDRYPALYGFSPTLVPRPPDWGDWIQISGYWFAPPTASWVAPPALEEFLDGDGPVVFAGFGSLPSLHGEQLFAELCEAARRVRARVVTTTVGWLGEDVTAPDDNVFVLDEAPHDWLFPRVDAVVHHGGAGTTHYGARSGRPAVVVPTFGDQFFWGHRAATAGIAPPPIPRKKATADRLASALSVVLENPTMRQNADRVGMAIQAERGVDEAVAGLGRWLN